MNLSDKVVLVTGVGAPKGIGRAIARAFAEKGCKLIINSLSDRVFECESELKKKGADVLALKGDVVDKGFVNSMVRDGIGKYGRIDVLVNNAGIYPAATVLEMKEEEWDRVINVNLKGPFLLSQAVGRHMVEQKIPGRIINIASTAGVSARVAASHYCSSKAGLFMFTKVLAMELAPYGIVVNGVAPGYIRTQPEPLPEIGRKYREAMISMIPVGKIGETTDIANTCLFLASDEVNFMTGETIIVDGGFTAGRMLPRIS